MKAHLGQSGSNMALMETRMEKLLSVVESVQDKTPPNESTEDEMHDSAHNEHAPTAPTDDTNNLRHSESTAFAANESLASEEFQPSGSSLFRRCLRGYRIRLPDSITGTQTPTLQWEKETLT